MNLWTPLRRGLVVDPNGKHIRQLRQAVWLLEYCYLHANWETGILIRKVSRIAQDMGMSPRTIRAWMRRLVAKGYVTIRRTGRASIIHIHRWQPLRRSSAGQYGKTLPLSAAGNGQHPSSRGRIGQQRRGGIGQVPSLNKSLLTRYLFREGDRSPPHDDDARIGLLANDLAIGLDDPESFDKYRVLAHRYPEPFLRELLSRARSVPSREIRQSRKALFWTLLTRYADPST
jgi:DNA-binding transcriptional ArsR family regulator